MISLLYHQNHNVFSHICIYIFSHNLCSKICLLCGDIKYVSQDIDYEMDTVIPLRKDDEKQVAYMIYGPDTLVPNVQQGSQYSWQLLVLV